MSNLIIKSNILQHFRVHHADLIDTVLMDDSGLLLTGEDLLHIIMSVYRSRPNEVVGMQKVLLDVPYLWRFQNFVESPMEIYYWQAIPMHIIELLIKDGFVEKFNVASGKYNPTKDIFELVDENLLEDKYSLVDAAKNDPVELAQILFTLPEDAIDDIIKHWLTRPSAEKSSLYNNPQGTQNSHRFSNHWNTPNCDNQLYTHPEVANDFWVFGEWDLIKKAWKMKGNYSSELVSRTPEQKALIVDALIDNIYEVNPFAVMKLEALKRSLLK